MCKSIDGGEKAFIHFYVCLFVIGRAMISNWVKTKSSRTVFLGYQIRSVNLEIGHTLSQIMEAAECTMSEFYILRADWDKGALTHAEIAAHADLPKTEMCEAFQELTKKKFITPVQDKSSTHQESYRLTEIGLEARQRLLSKYSNLMTSLCRGLSQKDIEQTLYVLMKLHENIHLRTEQSETVIPIR